MIQRLKRSWLNLRQYPPGYRFEQRYHRRKATGRGKVRKYVSLVGGGLVLAIGLFFLPAPGPGTPIVIIGAALLAEGSLPVARLLDRLEIRIRRVLYWLLHYWLAAPMPVKGALVLVALGVAGGLGFGAYLLLFNA